MLFPRPLGLHLPTSSWPITLAQSSSTSIPAGASAYRRSSEVGSPGRSSTASSRTTTKPSSFSRAPGSLARSRPESGTQPSWHITPISNPKKTVTASTGSLKNTSAGLEAWLKSGKPIRSPHNEQAQQETLG